MTHWGCRYSNKFICKTYCSLHTRKCFGCSWSSISVWTTSIKDTFLRCTSNYHIIILLYWAFWKAVRQGGHSSRVFHMPIWKARGSDRAGNDDNRMTVMQSDISRRARHKRSSVVGGGRWNGLQQEWQSKAAKQRAVFNVWERGLKSAEQSADVLCVCTSW